MNPNSTQGVILRQMTAGSVWLGPVDMACFIDALQSGDAVFLVELGALRQIGGAIEVLDLEEIAASLGPAGYDFRSHDFSKPPAVQRVPKSSQNRGLYAEGVAYRFGSKRQGPELQHGFRSHWFRAVSRLEG